MGKFSSLKRKKKSKSQTSINNNENEADSTRPCVSSYLGYSDSEFDECEEYPYQGDNDFPG